MNKSFTEEDVVKLHKGLMDKAVENIKRDGFLTPIFMVAASIMNIDAWLLKNTLPFPMFDDLRNYDGSDPNKKVVMMIPNLWEDYPLLVLMLKYIARDVDEATKQLDMMVNLAPAGITEPEKMIVAMCGLEPKDIIAKFVRKICKTCQADYVAHISEAWQKAFPKDEDIRKREHRDLEKYADRNEVILVSIETRLKQISASIPFKRQNGLGDGPVTEVGEPMIAAEVAGGRFMGMIELAS